MDDEDDPAAVPAGDAAAEDVAAEDVASLGYEAARDQLVEVVRALEGGRVTLEESLALWERGEALAERCQALLDGARERLAAVRGDEASPGPSRT